MNALLERQHHFLTPFSEKASARRYFECSQKYTILTLMYIPIAIAMQIVSTMAFPTVILNTHFDPCARVSSDGAIVHINCGFSNVSKEYLNTFGNNVRIAHLENNNFTTLEEDLFTVWPNLNKLYLDNNRYLVAVDFYHKTLKYLSLADCGFEDFNISVFKNLPSLKCAYLGGNHACAIAQENAEEQCMNFSVNCGSECPIVPYTCASIPKKSSNYILPIVISIITFILLISLALRKRPMVRTTDVGEVII